MPYVGHTKLSSVHNVAIQLASHFGHAVDFTKYSELLLSECAQVDSALAHSPRKSGKRSVYFTDLTINDGEDDDHHHLSSADEVDYSIDSDPVTLLASAHKRREMNANHVLMHRDQWTGVSPEGQKIWDQLSEEDKGRDPKEGTYLQLNEAVTFHHPFGNLIAAKLTSTKPLCMTLLWLTLTN